MTAIAELQRIARDVVPPRGATAPIAVVEHTPGGRLGHPLEAYPNGVGGSTRYGVAWLIDGRVRTKPIVTFDRGRDAIALIRILQGERPTSRPAPATEPPYVAARDGEDQERIETPVAGTPLAPLPLPSPALEVRRPRAESGTASRSPRTRAAGAMPESRLCAGCDEPLPADARPNRATHDDRCRQRAAYRRATATAQEQTSASGKTSRFLDGSDAGPTPEPGGRLVPVSGDRMFEEVAGLGRRTLSPPPAPT